MIALVGDAELDEGNVHEALLEAWKHDVRNVWWVIDYNRQSLDSVISDRLFDKIEAMFRNIGWRVVTLKYGRELEATFRRPGGQALRAWIDACPNALYSALVFKGGASWRERLAHDLSSVAGVERLLAERDDASLARLMTNLAGHDLRTVLDAFHALIDDRPTCIIAYTIKGYGLPIAGHKDNHPGLMTEEQVERFRADNGIMPGAEWDRFAGLDIPAADVERFLSTVPIRRDHLQTASACARAGAGGDAAARRRADVDAGRVRPAAGRIVPHRRPIGRPNHHHLAGRDDHH